MILDHFWADLGSLGIVLGSVWCRLGFALDHIFGSFSTVFFLGGEGRRAMSVTKGGHLGQKIVWRSLKPCFEEEDQLYSIGEEIRSTGHE